MPVNDTIPVGIPVNIFYHLLAPRPSPPSPPPPHYQPHPSPSVLKGLLAAHEAELEVRRAGPDPLVSPRLKGSDYMENQTHILYTCTWKHWTHWHTATARAHQRQTPYISFVQASGMGDACAANKVTVICAILFQSWSCYPQFLWKAKEFSSHEPTLRLFLKVFSEGR